MIPWPFHCRWRTVTSNPRRSCDGGSPSVPPLPGMRAALDIHQARWATLEMDFFFTFQTSPAHSWRVIVASVKEIKKSLTEHRVPMAWLCAAAQYFHFNKMSPLCLTSQSLCLLCVVLLCRRDVGRRSVNSAVLVFLCESRDNEKSFICPRLHGFLLHTDRKPFFLRVKDTTSPAH